MGERRHALPVEGPSAVELPLSVRRHLAELAAAALGDLPEQEVPASLRRVRAFAPARRARAAAGPLLAALDGDAVLRGHAALLWATAHPDLAADLPAAAAPEAVDGPPTPQPVHPEPGARADAGTAAGGTAAGGTAAGGTVLAGTAVGGTHADGTAVHEDVLDGAAEGTATPPDGPDVPSATSTSRPQRPTGPRLPDHGDEETWLVGAYLSRPRGWPQLVAVLLERLADQEAHRRARHSEAAARVRADTVAGELHRVRADLARAEEQVAALTEEIAGLRREQRRLRADADRARAAARTAEQDAARVTAQAHAVQHEAEVALQRAADQAAEAESQLAQARRTAREGRSLADVRARLLLDTIVEAAGSLRRELALPPVTQQPADLVVPASASAFGPTPSPAARAQAGDDPALLEQLLALPQSHLVVDGYNVTKTGYGSLPLAEQRRRLVDALGVLAVRTSSEVTCCFDGAEVDARGASRVRGVRVIFSEPGTTADDLIRRLVRAEPPGRPVVVVSSDAEVAASSRGAGARAVPSTALLRLLRRG